MESLQDKAKQLSQKLNAEGVEKYDYTDEALELLQEYDAETNNINIVDDDGINQYIEYDLKNYGWQRVACFLAKVDSLNAPYGYRLDGYGNLCELTFDDIKMYIDEIINY